MLSAVCLHLTAPRVSATRSTLAVALAAVRSSVCLRLQAQRSPCISVAAAGKGAHSAAQGRMGNEAMHCTELHCTHSHCTELNCTALRCDCLTVAANCKDFSITRSLCDIIHARSQVAQTSWSLRGASDFACQNVTGKGKKWMGWCIDQSIRQSCGLPTKPTMDEAKSPSRLPAERERRHGGAGGGVAE